MKGRDPLPGNADNILPNAAQGDICYLAPRTPCWTVVTLVTTRTLQASSAMLLSSWMVTSMYGWNFSSPDVGLCISSGTSRGSCQPIFSSLLRTLWMPTQPSSIPNTTPRFVPSPSFLRVHPAPTSWSLIRKLN